MCGLNATEIEDVSIKSWRYKLITQWRITDWNYLKLDDAYADLVITSKAIHKHD